MISEFLRFLTAVVGIPEDGRLGVSGTNKADVAHRGTDTEVNPESWTQLKGSDET